MCASETLYVSDDQTRFNEDNDYNNSLPRSSCFSAKLRAMSERYLQSSTNRFLAKLYKNQDAPTEKSSMANVDIPSSKFEIPSPANSSPAGSLPAISPPTNSTPANSPSANSLSANSALASPTTNNQSTSGSGITGSTPVRSKSKRKTISAKLRSFSYGALPGLDDFQKNHSRLYDEDQLSSVRNNDQVLLVGEQSPMVDDQALLIDNRASLMDAQAFLIDDQASLIGDLASLIGDQSIEDQAIFMDNEDSDSGILVTDSASSSVIENENFHYDTCSVASESTDHKLLKFDDLENDSLKRKNHQRILSLDREICKGTISLPVENRKHEVPVLPFPLPHNSSNGVLVKLVKQIPAEELGILIAKKSNFERRYVIAHLVPGCIAQRLLLLTKSITFIHF